MPQPALPKCQCAAARIWLATDLLPVGYFHVVFTVPADIAWQNKAVVDAKPPFAGPQAVLAYLSRYTHHVAISNRRLTAFDETGATFRNNDYRRTGPNASRSCRWRRTSSRLPSHPALCRSGQQRQFGIGSAYLPEPSALKAFVRKHSKPFT